MKKYRAFINDRMIYQSINSKGHITFDGVYMTELNQDRVMSSTGETDKYGTEIYNLDYVDYQGVVYPVTDEDSLPSIRVKGKLLRLFRISKELQVVGNLFETDINDFKRYKF